jgi:hypothetical protein
MAGRKQTQAMSDLGLLGDGRDDDPDDAQPLQMRPGQPTILRSHPGGGSLAFHRCHPCMSSPANRGSNRFAGTRRVGGVSADGRVPRTSRWSDVSQNYRTMGPIEIALQHWATLVPVAFAFDMSLLADFSSEARPDFALAALVAEASAACAVWSSAACASSAE